MSQQPSTKADSLESAPISAPVRFEDLGLSAISLEAIMRKGFELPTKVQAEVIPRLIAGDCDVIAQSHTGTGKTAAFGLPLIQKLEPAKGPVQALIMTPTRELAVQVAEEINSLRGSKPLHVVPIYGGQSYELQFRHLRQGVDILVGTPGRIIDHLNRGSLKLDKVRWVVLDEADEMLDMGFVDDIEAILGTCTAEKRMLLFSATMPSRIRSMAETWMRNIVHVAVKTTALTTANTEEAYMEVLEQDKFEALCRIVDHAPDFYGMVFGRTKVECDNLHRRLQERGYDAEVLHGDINQSGREKVLESFRKRNTDILVATDVAARGIDVEALTHVINYSLPSDSESYVHRIGRTGRAGREGRAITFVTPSEFRKLSMIQRASKSEIKRERPPRVDEILEQKRSRLSEELKACLLGRAEDGQVLPPPVPEIFSQLATELVDHSRTQGLESADMLARILHARLADDLDPARYGKVTEILPGGRRMPGQGGDSGYQGRDSGYQGRDSAYQGREGRESRPHQGTANGGVRLYVARGKIDGFTKPQLVEFIRRGSGVRDRLIDNVEVYEYYSFITVPPEEAEVVKAAFTEGGKDGKPIVRAADANDAGAHSYSSGGGGGYNGGGGGGYKGRRPSGHKPYAGGGGAGGAGGKKPHYGPPGHGGGFKPKGSRFGRDNPR